MKAELDEKYSDSINQYIPINSSNKKDGSIMAPQLKKDKSSSSLVFASYNMKFEDEQTPNFPKIKSEKKLSNHEFSHRQLSSNKVHVYTAEVQRENKGARAMPYNAD